MFQVAQLAVIDWRREGGGAGAVTGRTEGEMPSRVAAGAYLGELLGRRDYRRRWERHLGRPGDGTVNQAAVARVLADYLVDSGEWADDEGNYRQLKDRVARALSGRALGPETLRWFVEAFGMEQGEVERLYSLLAGAGETGGSPGWDPYMFEGGQPELETISLQEIHELGPDGVPVSHRTNQVVRALRDGADSYLYRFDSCSLRVEMSRGGRAGPVRTLGAGLFGVDISFVAPLEAGQTCSLEYVTTFAYEQAPPPVFRRGVSRQVESLEILVRFHPDRLPARVEWCRWDSLDHPPSAAELVRPGAEHFVQRYLPKARSTIVGFRWEWP